ncbi:virion structural protein [Synechococcus phage S-PM2]|uniref:Virion structural protein n=2 Tax=Caudoviricetes TaxID=2731619 RepID=Q5GQG2_BPSYP|nr:virion structural protein [Synechococcus phage S-PM2]CAF34240.1 virion structural protein [Synechococcus phage S-PM2]CFW42383.1 virion structural protein [Synechococcus phage S-PM2]
MSDRFPLIVNETSRRIEELIAGDNLDLTGNGIALDGDVGLEGQSLHSNGSVVEWRFAGDVFLTGIQSVSDKIFSNCNISGTENALSNIGNDSLENSSITINGTSIPLGGSVTTADTNTTYSFAAVDGTTDVRKTIRLTSGGSGTSTDQDVTLVAGTNVSLTRAGNDIQISSSFTDTDTITTLRSAVGGNATSGDISIAGSGSTTVSQSVDGLTITIDSTDTDTITRLRGGTGENFLAGDFTLIAGDEVTLSQTGRDITINSVDTITRLKGGATGSFKSGDVTFTGSGATTVSQSQDGSTITIDSIDTNTITRIRGSNGGTLTSGDVTFLGSGVTTVEQSPDGRTITISSTDQDTTYDAALSGGLFLSGTSFSLKNNENINDQTIVKWDSSNFQLTNSIITDDGSTVTIGGDLLVTGTTTTINTQNLVVADNNIELRRGENLTGSNGGIQLNRTTDGTGLVTSFNAMQWFESGGYWRTWDGSVPHRLVTDDEIQTLTNKTLDSPTLNFPSLGAATATSINGLSFGSTVSASLSVGNSKAISFNNSVTFNTAQNDSTITVQLSNGGTVAYTSNTLAVFASTTSNQLRGVISDSTGVGKAVFNQNPSFADSITTSSSTFSVFNTGVTNINAFGAATTITMGAISGTTTIRNSLQVDGSATIGNESGDIITVNGATNFNNEDLTLRGSSDNPIKIGRGGNAIATNTRVGYRALESNTTGANNTAFGYESSFVLNTGSNNTSFGYQALRSSGIGEGNVAFGSQSCISVTEGVGNVGVGTLTLSSVTDTNYNVCIGHYAGAALTGSGNVLIGPASTEDSLSATYAPPAPTGNNQLVIASGTGVWIRGDNGFNVVMPNNVTIQKNLQISGDLTVNGTTTTVNSRVVTIDDKAIELGAVATINFVGNATLNSNVISNLPTTAGLIVGMEVQVLNVGITLPPGTIITSIGTDQIVLNGNIGGSGGTNVTFTAIGPSDTTANGGGIIVRGSTNKTILYDNDGILPFWKISDNVDIPSGKVFSINESSVLSATTLGSSVVNSSLTSVGTLQSLSVTGNVNLKGRITEKVVNNFVTSITPVSNELEVSAANGNTIIGTLAASAINTWNFTNLGLTNGSSITLTLIVDGNATAIYGDACKVEGNSITGGIQWSGGSPPANTSNIDILTFIVVRDTSGVTKVYGQGNTGFS